jgi:hypothetical protein
LASSGAFITYEKDATTLPTQDPFEQNMAFGLIVSKFGTKQGLDFGL